MVQPVYTLCDVLKLLFVGYQGASGNQVFEKGTNVNDNKSSNCVAFNFHNNLEKEISSLEQNTDNPDTNNYEVSNFITSSNLMAQDNSSCNNDENIRTNTGEDKFDENITIESRYTPSAFVTDHLNSDEISCASELIVRM